MKEKNIFKRFSGLTDDVKQNPEAFKVAVASFFVMGLGQLLNKQKIKALFLFLVSLVFLIIELLTSSYIYAFSELAQYPVQAGEKLYFFRDYGGFLTRGMWGLFTLGRVPADVMYRGQFTETYNKALPWLSGDNSITLLGNGLIALIFVSILVSFWIFNIKDAYNSRKEIIKTGKVETGKEFITRIWDTAFAYIIIVPSIILILFFTVVPFLFSFLLAFTNYTYRIPIPSRLVEWVGFKNFSMIVTNADWFSIFIQVFGWTLFYAFMASFTVYVLGFIQAMIVESKYVKFKKVWRILLIIPWAVPAMISQMLFRNAFHKDGLINQILYATDMMQPVSNFLYNIGLAGQADSTIFWVDTVYNGTLAKAVVIIVNLWLGAPYFMMLIVGVLSTLPKDLYEAASIDGATAVQKFKTITLPLVLRATIPVIVMTFTFNFNNFGAIYFLTGGGPKWDPNLVPESMKIMGGIPGQTDILISWIYKLSFTANAQLYNIAAVYSILIFIFVGFFAVWNLAKSKTLWED